MLTHKGRSSSSGHYVAWSRYRDDEWLMFDDENVTSVTSEDIGKLSGGGDWHCAYMLLYGPRKLKVNSLSLSLFLSPPLSLSLSPSLSLSLSLHPNPHTQVTEEEGPSASVEVTDKMVVDC